MQPTGEFDEFTLASTQSPQIFSQVSLPACLLLIVKACPGQWSWCKSRYRNVVFELWTLICEVGRKSSGDDFEGIFLISRSTSVVVAGWNLDIDVPQKGWSDSSRSKCWSNSADVIALLKFSNFVYEENSQCQRALLYSLLMGGVRKSLTSRPHTTSVSPTSVMGW